MICGLLLRVLRCLSLLCLLFVGRSVCLVCIVRGVCDVSFVLVCVLFIFVCGVMLL